MNRTTQNFLIMIVIILMLVIVGYFVGARSVTRNIDSYAIDHEQYNATFRPLVTLDCGYIQERNFDHAGLAFWSNQTGKYIHAIDLKEICAE